MNSAVQDAIALALREQCLPNDIQNTNEEASAIHQKDDPSLDDNMSRPAIDIRRSFNGLRVGLPLISAALSTSDEPDEALEQMMKLIRNLSTELIGDLNGNINPDDAGQKSAILRTAILKCVESAAINDRLEDINEKTLVTLINQALCLTDVSEQTGHRVSNFNVHFLISTGLTAKTFIDSESEFKKHTKAMLDITHQAFSELLKYEIDNSQLQFIQQSFLVDLSALYKRIAEDEIRKNKSERLSLEGESLPLVNIIEKRYQTYLFGVVNAAIKNAEVRSDDI
ncbi:hypothetical protein [Salinimonas iocasae]|uniref:Uncharacterized protein n=1 Tax=Salinimonas iocasae TaxID=2572577 RepID=A0A5B7YJG6_9ALTE|nr:hypothetical protein [Salinimonas iocasae]QCZ95516.1 hypothetical protein FBQ74_18520 [Salinimonas iocasae]